MYDRQQAAQGTETGGRRPQNRMNETKMEMKNAWSFEQQAFSECNDLQEEV